MAKIRRAIISCHDKTGVVEFARVLCEFGVEIISTAGTLKVLSDAGIEAVNMADFTGVREMMGGRVKTLDAKVHAGLLGIRDNKLHCEQLQAADYQWIDLAVVNLHPVASLIQAQGITMDEVLDQIDIGGATILRSAAKNFRYVTVVVNPERYSTVMHEMRAHEGEITFATRFRLAREAFACVAQYDQTVAGYLDSLRIEEE
jgi:phosphoribosylaminoimidazolecarboxamide formyltransferase / IMP cyclohydrolase